jgi:hypothetical protein
MTAGDDDEHDNGSYSSPESASGTDTPVHRMSGYCSPRSTPAHRKFCAHVLRMRFVCNGFFLFLQLRTAGNVPSSILQVCWFHY